MAELGPAKKSRAGPGEEVAPKPTAAIKSIVPIIFQIQMIGRAVGLDRYASHAMSGAVIPTKMSPQPATGANGAGRRLDA